MSSKTKIKQYNDLVQIIHHNNVEVPDPNRIQKVVKVLSKMPKGKLLDVGYSKGSFSDYLKTLGWECVGLDINKHESSRFPVIQCDLNDGFPVDTESYDVITSGEVIEHMIDEASFLNECRRVLKKNGTLVLTTPNLSFIVNRFIMFTGGLPMFVYAPYHYHFHTKKSITRIVEECGFKVEKVMSSHILYSSRRHWSGKIFEWLGDIFPSFGAHLIVFAKKN